MANRRFEMYQYRQVLSRLRLGESSRSIARSGLMGRPKVEAFRRLVEQKGWLDASVALPDEATIAQALPRRAPRPQTESLVVPHQEVVKKWWEQGIRVKRIYRKLVESYGFTGSYSSVRRFARSIERSVPRVTTVLDFDPGDAAQVDFGRGPTITDVFTSETFRTWMFVMVLAWSRHQYAEIVRDQKVETWLGCHRRAFEFFGGVPARLIIDNLKAAIVKACYYDPVVQRAYGECAEAYGFRISPCPVAEPTKKARVERGVQYLTDSFLPLRDFRGLWDSNQQLLDWIMGEAGNRIHGTTHERPLTRFVQVERAFLRPLPAVAPELGVWAKVKVHGDCHVLFEKCFYSVPWQMAHKHLWLCACEKTTRVFHDCELVAIHPRLRKPGSRSTNPEHLPPEARAFLMRDPQWCLKQAQTVGSACFSLVVRLLTDAVLDNLRAVQGIIRLGEHYGQTRLEAACRRALSYDNPRYRTVKQILEKGLDQQTDLWTRVALTGAYTGTGRFCRDTKTLFL